MRILNAMLCALVICFGFIDAQAKPEISKNDQGSKYKELIQPIESLLDGKIMLTQGGMHHGMGHGRMGRGRMGEGCGPDGMGHGQEMGCGRHGHHGGMGPGGNYDGEGNESAICPQQRSTTKAPQSYYSMKNPLKNNSENIEEGRLLFQLDAQPSCTACHGSGDGLGMMSGGLNPPPRNFICSETMNAIPDGQLFWIIQNGSSGTAMPSFQELAAEQIWQLIIYIRSLAK